MRLAAQIPYDLHLPRTRNRFGGPMATRNARIHGPKVGANPAKLWIPTCRERTCQAGNAIRRESHACLRENHASPARFAADLTGKPPSAPWHRVCFHIFCYENSTIPWSCERMCLDGMLVSSSASHTPTAADLDEEWASRGADPLDYFARRAGICGAKTLRNK